MKSFWQQPARSHLARRAIWLLALLGAARLAWPEVTHPAPVEVASLGTVAGWNVVPPQPGAVVASPAAALPVWSQPPPPVARLNGVAVAVPPPAAEQHWREVAATLLATPTPPATPAPLAPLAPTATVAALVALVEPPPPVVAAEPATQASLDQGAAAPATWSYEAMFQQVAAEYGLNWRLLASLAYTESRLNPNAVGRDGERGLTQILPSTWDALAPQLGLSDPFDPTGSTRAAAHFLVSLNHSLAAQGYPELYWALAAYNWGPRNVRQLLATTGGDWSQVPLAKQEYVWTIMREAADPTAPWWATRLAEPLP